MYYLVYNHIYTMETTNYLPTTIHFPGFSGKHRRDPVKLMMIVDHKNLGTLEKIISHKEWGRQVIYILTDSSEVKARFQYRSRIYPVKANIRSLLRHDIVDEIVCCMTNLPDGYMEEITGICSQFGVALLISPGLGSAIPFHSKLRYIGSFSFYTLENSPRNFSTYMVKTVLEMIIASVGLFLLSPVLVFMGVLIKTTSKGPVIFRQQRVGLRGRKFYIYKFRTMIVDAEKLKSSLMAFNESDGPAFKIRNDPRITRVGRFMRKTGIDEIPQLYNVMKGDMSLIGPRPMLPAEVSEHAEWQLKRMSIKPGITCSWQIIPDRNSVSFEHWMKLDREYVENWSIKKDMVLFIRTIKTMIVARGL
jgi:exopolysaccharide biosynthesis polyprenyl glycosylphosphotransferase